MKTQDAIGKLLGEDAGRDAIHIAVAPLVAACQVHVGEHVGLTADGRMEPVAVSPIGIVDPFLERDVERGERAFVFLYPNTITNLNHVWTHPAFDGAPRAVPAVSDEDRDESREFLEKCATAWGRTYAGLMEILGDYADEGDDWFFDNSEKYKSLGRIDPNSDWDTFWPKFWEHYRRVTGRQNTRTDCPFTCSC